MVSDLKTYAHKRSKIIAWISFYLFTTFKRLFAPTSQSPMSRLFRISESLGKSNGKKWSQIERLLLIKGVKSLRRNKREKKISANFALLAEFFWYWCYYLYWLREALSPVCGFFILLKKLVLRLSFKLISWGSILTVILFPKYLPSPRRMTHFSENKYFMNTNQI